MASLRMTIGAKGWIGLATYIIGFDIYAIATKKDTLSMAFYNGLRHPIRRWPVILTWVGITAHLFHFVPDRYDPLRCLTKNGRLAARFEDSEG